MLWPLLFRESLWIRDEFAIVQEVVPHEANKCLKFFSRGRANWMGLA